MNLRTFLIIFTFCVIAFFAPVLFSPASIPGNFGDVYMHYYPLKALAAEHLINGQLPLWNPYIFAGQPILANPQSAVFYPFSLLFSFFPLPFAFSLFSALHIFLAGLFMYLLLITCRLPRSASALGSIVFAFSSFLIYRVPAGHPVILSGYVWLPLVLLSLKYLRRAPSFHAEILLAGVLALQFLSGHAVPFYTAVIMAFLYWAMHRFFGPMSIARAALLFLALIAVQLGPTLELSRATETAKWDVLTVSYSLPLKSLGTLIAPWHFWQPADPAFIPSFFFEQHDLYFGILPLCFAAAGFLFTLRGRSFFFPALFLTAMVIAAGTATPLFGLISRIIPGMEFVRVPARFAVLAILACAALAGSGAKTILAGRHSAFKMILFTLVLGELFLWNHRFIYAESMVDYRKPSPLSQAVSPMYRMITEPERMAADKAMLYHHFNLNGYEAVLLRGFTGYLGLQESRVLSPTGLARADFFSPPARGLAAAYRVTSEILSGREPSASFGALKVYPISGALPRVFVPRRLVAIPGRDEAAQTAYLRSTPYAPDEECLLDFIPETFSAVSPASTIYSINVAASKIAVDLSTDGPAALVFSEMAYPGWKAAAGGRTVPLVKANMSLRAALLPGGEYRGTQRVYVYFLPETMLFGLYITLGGFIFFGGYIFKKVVSDKW